TPPGRRRSGAGRPAGWRERCERSAAGSACRRLQDGEQALQGGGIETRTNAEHALAGQEDLQASLLGRVHLGRAVGTDVDGHEGRAGGGRGGDVASRGGSRRVAFGEDAAPGIEQGSRELVGPTKGVHGLPARLPALQELPPVLLLGGVASPVRHGWSPPGHGDPNTLCKTDFAGRSRWGESSSPDRGADPNPPRKKLTEQLI